tara:strand:- start:73 stop:2979 length:2907 start_codon:yes stop_codon:yes gene_type:complete
MSVSADPKKRYANLFEFLQKHKVTKGSDTSTITNTRIGDGTSIYPGSYSIPDDEYETFLDIYGNEMFVKNTNKKEYLTEKQRVNTGVLVVDIDFRYSYEVDERQFTSEHVDDVIDLYLELLKKIYNFDENAEFQIFVMTKETVNRVKEKNCTKDGIHLLFTFQVERDIQMYIREQILKEIPNIWTDMPIINTFEDVFDKGITAGTVNWQLYGSRKPGYDRYKISRILDVTFDPNDNEFSYDEASVSKFDLKRDLMKLSVRNTNIGSALLKNSFIPVYDDYKRKSNLSSVTRRVNVTAQIDTSFDINTLSQIQTKDELDMVKTSFLDSLTQDDHEILEAHELAMALPVSYYGNGSYDKWQRVGWCLRNISDRLLITWLCFSAKSEIFDYRSIPDLCDKWRRTSNRNTSGGITKKSLLNWVREDNRTEYDRIAENSVDCLVDQALSQGGKPGSRGSDSGCSDFDLANVLYTMHKHKFVCVSVRADEWLYYEGHRWKSNEKGMKLRQQISKSFRNLFRQKASSLASIRVDRFENDNKPDNKPDNNEENTQDNASTRENLMISRCNMLITRLGSTSEKQKIMTECRELCYDSDFLDNLDANPYLLCCNNGVYDFKLKLFRSGLPEDYLSMSTNIDYVQLKPEHDVIVCEINTFMKQLFPEDELCQYMWDHLSSALLGTSTNQTFNMYIGGGSNGKSVLIDLMSKVLGDYKCDVPLSLITDKRGKVGGVSPEIVGLKGKRYAVMQEPQEDDVINEGIMKQLTSGKDPVQGRAPYMPQVVSFMPQFKLVVASNHFMKVKATDHGTWRRIRSVPFKALFTNNPVDTDPEKPYQFKTDVSIDEKFESWKEVFLSMLIEHACKTDGIVKDCDIVLEQSNDYRKSMDILSAYMDEQIVRDPTKTVGKTEINQDFLRWHETNYGNRGPSPKKLHEIMTKTFGKCINLRWKGCSFKSYEKETDESAEEELQRMTDGSDSN